MFLFRDQFLTTGRANDFLDEFSNNVGKTIDTVANLDLEGVLEGGPGDLLGDLSPTGLLGSDINNFISDTLFG